MRRTAAVGGVLALGLLVGCAVHTENCASASYVAPTITVHPPKASSGSGVTASVEHLFDVPEGCAESIELTPATGSVVFTQLGRETVIGKVTGGGGNFAASLTFAVPDDVVAGAATVELRTADATGTVIASAGFTVRP